MKLEEIWVNPPRDEYLDDKNHYFDNATPVVSIKGLILKRSVRDSDVFYGLFKDDVLVGYLGLTHRPDGKYQVGLSQLAQAYKGQGLGTFLYDYAILNDNRVVLSDNRQTPDSQQLWNRFRQNVHFNVVPFDLNTNEPTVATDEQVYSSDHLVWMATPTGKTINESLSDINAMYKGDRYVVWYGSSSDGYVNY